MNTFEFTLNYGEDWQNQTSSLIEYNNFKEYMFQNIIWLSS